MELLEFYLGSIIASMLLLLVLGFLGYHLIARSQSLEVLLLGQEFQTSILVAALTISILPHLDYNHHGIHLEIVITLLFAVLSHLIFRRVFRKYPHIKTEGVVGYIVFLMGLNQLVILTSPLIEMHMVRSYIGDIVTVSKAESYFLSVTSVCILFLLIGKRASIYQDSLETALFGKVTKMRNNELLFNIVTLVIMLLSIHQFGILFTLAAIMVPGLFNSYYKLTHRDMFFQLILGSFSPIFAFILTSYNDRLPTTVLILFVVIAINLLYAIVKSRNQQKQGIQ